MQRQYFQTNEGYIFTSDYAHNECVKLTVKAGKAALIDQCKKQLLQFLSPGVKVYTKVNSVSSSGMRRRISAYVANGDSIQQLDYWISIVTGWKLSDKGGLIVSGCGMDMGFHLVYTLGAILWPNGTDGAHGTRNGEPDFDGGYALKQVWM